MKVALEKLAGVSLCRSAAKNEAVADAEACKLCAMYY
jgi:hypothetical protein